MSPKTTKSILVTGDVIRDIYIYEGDRHFPPQQGKVPPHLVDKPGGAKALHEIIEAAAPGASHFGLELPKNDQLHGVHTLWNACEGGTKKERDEAAKEDKPKPVWRVAKPLGYDLGTKSGTPLARSKAGEPVHSVLVIDDAGLGFRNVAARKRSWPAGIGREEKQQPDWILHKMGNPPAQGDLWRALVAGPSAGPARKQGPARRENLVVIVSADGLRRAGAAITRGFSWERTLTDLCAELNHNPQFQPLLRFPRHLIVNFGCVGSVWLKDVPGAELAQDRATLIYDPTLAEGGWKTRLADEEHKVYGHLNTFTAALAIHVFDLVRKGGPGGPLELTQGIQRGLDACRQLRLSGHGLVSDPKPGLPLDKLAPLLQPSPVDVATAAGLRRKLTPAGYQTVISPPGRFRPDQADTWTLAALSENLPSQFDLPLYGLAHRVALQGVPALEHIPHAQFRDLLSVDRTEIETLRSLFQMIERFVGEKAPKAPLCIGAFGPPGAGKSFGIKEIARQILGKDGKDGKDVPVPEFNLAQYNDSSELIGAFHQVRDHVLKGAVPVVFWDEFDSRNYQWLQYLLAPMQDGTFQENGHTHMLGKCIFVFAGATSWDFEHFGPAPAPQTEADRNTLEARLARDKALRAAEAAAHDDFVRKKGPDFLSRLDGYINVLGPNQRMLYDWSTRTWRRPDSHDITFPVRRALLLRQFLGAKKPGDILSIDRDLLRAFLQVPRYRHGARSLEKIAKPLAATSKPFSRAHLPPPQVLTQHLESAAAFDAIHQENRQFLAPSNLRSIAAAIADFYDSRYLPGYVKRSARKAQAVFEAHAGNSDPWMQWTAATNLAAAERLPQVLALAGLGLERGAATPAEKRLIAGHLEHHLRVLAKEEHDLWVEFHRSNGWRQADKATLKRLAELKAQNDGHFKKERDRLKREERIHTLMVPFESLPDHEKSKDHDAILNYPAIVGLIGWKIVFTVVKS